MATAAVAITALAGTFAPAGAAEPPSQDQAFFDELAKQGLHPDYDKQVCGSIKCEPLGELLIAEGHVVCNVLAGGEAPLVPFAVIENLNISPGEAEAFITAARHGYCPGTPDPYSPHSTPAR